MKKTSSTQRSSRGKSGTPQAKDRYLRRTRPPRRYNPKRRRQRVIFTSVLVLLITVVSAAGLYAAGSCIHRYLVTADRFTIRSIELVGNQRVRMSDLTDMGQRLEVQTNIFALQLEELEQLIRQHPWVGSCTVKRILPDTLQISVTEKAPAGLVDHGGRTVLVDDEGVVMAREPESLDWSDRFPMITGFGAEEAWEICQERVRTGLTVVRLLAGGMPDSTERPACLPEVVAVDAGDNSNMALLFKDTSYPVYLGSVDFDQRLARFTLLYQTISQRHGGDLQYVDLRFRDRVIVMPTAGIGKEDAVHGQNG